MCGRYQLEDPKAQYEIEFSIKGPVPNWRPRINFSPTNHGPFVTAEREMRIGTWGLVPSWSKTGKMEGATFNARSETVRTKPTFRTAFKQRRCIVPADAFFEWTGPKADRIPHRIWRTDGKPLAIAGLWETWGSKEGSETVTSYTLVVTSANGFMSAIHDRMPVILEAEDYERWLTGTPDEAEALMKPGKEGILDEAVVNKALNSSRNEGKWLLDPTALPPKAETAGGDLR